MLAAFESADMSAHSKSYPRNPWLIDSASERDALQHSVHSSRSRGIRG